MANVPVVERHTSELLAGNLTGGIEDEVIPNSKTLQRIQTKQRRIHDHTH